jgi:hypothetical protein
MEYQKLCSRHKECASESPIKLRGKCIRMAHQKDSRTQGRSLKITEHLGGETVQRKAQRDRIVEDFLELCQVHDE